jgi:site-specific DNA-methyltransferase (adenine-specific)
MRNTLARNKEMPTFFGEVQFKGERKGSDFKDNQKPTVIYNHPDGKLWQGDCIEWLKSLPSESVDMIFADPPYNIKKAEWDTFESQEEYIKFSIQWIEQAARVLKPTGTLFICGFSEILADIKHPATKFFKSCRWIIWYYKNKANLGKDWGRSHESILHFRKTKNFTFNIDTIRIPYSEHTLKYPSHPQATTSQYSNSNKNDNTLWEPNPLGAKPKDVLEIPQDIIEVPTTCNGMHEKTPHPTQKPEELLRKLILASSNPGDIILDPFCGSGTTPVCAQQLDRKWMACDLSDEYLNWAIDRIELVEDWTTEQWIKYDFENQKRRNSIR